MSTSPPLEQLAAIRDALESRPQLIARARQEGHTWRQIADAAGMTPNGLRKALDAAGIDFTEFGQPTRRRTET